MREGVPLTQLFSVKELVRGHRKVGTVSRAERLGQRGQLGSNEGHQNTRKRETQIKTTGRRYLPATRHALGKRGNNECR